MVERARIVACWLVIRVHPFIVLPYFQFRQCPVHLPSSVLPVALCFSFNQPSMISSALLSSFEFLDYFWDRFRDKHDLD